MRDLRGTGAVMTDAVQLCARKKLPANIVKGILMHEMVLKGRGIAPDAIFEEISRIAARWTEIGSAGWNTKLFITEEK